MENVNKFFEEIEAHPNSKKAKDFQKMIYKEYKEKSTNLNKALSATQKEQLDFLKKACEAIDNDTALQLRVNQLKDLLPKIDDESLIKNIAIPNQGNYKYVYFLEKLVAVTQNEGLKNYVRSLKDEIMRANSAR